MNLTLKLLKMLAVIAALSMAFLATEQPLRGHIFGADLNGLLLCIWALFNMALGLWSRRLSGVCFFVFVLAFGVLVALKAST